MESQRMNITVETGNACIHIYIYFFLHASIYLKMVWNLAMLKVIKIHIQDGVRSPNLLRKDEHEENAGVGGGAGEAT